MQTVPAANSSSAGRPRRKPFTAIRKGRAEHVLSGRLRGTAFAVYIWLHMQADHRTGTVRSNAGRLATEIGLHPVGEGTRTAEKGCRSMVIFSHGLHEEGIGEATR